MQAAFGDVTDIHRGALAHRLETFEHLDTICGILLFREFHIFLLYHYLSLNQ